MATDRQAQAPAGLKPLPETTFGRTLATLRTAIGLSQKQLAKAVGVTSPTVWHWEQRNRLPRRSNRDRLNHLLGVDALAATGAYLSDLCSHARAEPAVLDERPADRSRDRSSELADRAAASVDEVAGWHSSELSRLVAHYSVENGRAMTRMLERALQLFVGDSSPIRHGSEQGRARQPGVPDRS